MDSPDAPLIRSARPADARSIAALLSAMLVDMEVSGGHAVADTASREHYFADLVSKGFDRPEWFCVVAETSEGTLGGAASAEITSLPAVFAPKRSLHISTLYVVPERRRLGTGARMAQTLMTWGREQGCAEADLNVLVANPARLLYEGLGFVDAQRKMTIDLSLPRERR